MDIMLPAERRAMSKLKTNERISYEEAKLRALGCLKEKHPANASWVAMHIWPGHMMKAQGAGAAASRILKRMEREGLCRWRCQYDATGVAKWWGWVKMKL